MQFTTLLDLYSDLGHLQSHPLHKELDGRDMHDTQDEFFLSIMRIMHILLIM